jgi:Ran GTPase-activating protein (RanGAP) involved in mRNA processing and transport
MGSEGVPDLPLLLLQKSTVLKALVVGEYYRFGGGGVGKLFFDALAKNVTLRTLGLQVQDDYYSVRSEEWMEQLADALMVNKSLVSINLTGNLKNDYDKGAKWIGAALKVNTSLREIDLTHNGIYCEGSKLLGDALRENTTLFKIVLCNNCISNRGADWIAKVRFHCRSQH